LIRNDHEDLKAKDELTKEFQIAYKVFKKMKTPKILKEMLFFQFYFAPLTLDLNQESPQQKKGPKQIHGGIRCLEMSRYVSKVQERKLIRINSKFPSHVKAERMNLTCLQFTSLSPLSKTQK